MLFSFYIIVYFIIITVMNIFSSHYCRSLLLIISPPPKKRTDNVISGQVMLNVLSQNLLLSYHIRDSFWHRIVFVAFSTGQRFYYKLKYYVAVAQPMTSRYKLWIGSVFHSFPYENDSAKILKFKILGTIQFSWIKTYLFLRIENEYK